MKTDGTFTPFLILEHEDGLLSLLLTEFDACYEIFDEAGYESGGYGWHGVAEALIRLKAPHLADAIDFSPEASMFSARSKSRASLEELARLLLSAMHDESFLKTALENADAELMD